MLTGSRFQGISQASGGNFQDSSSNYPVVQLLSLENSQVTFLLVDPTAGWSDTAFTSTRVTGFAFGPALVTVFTNGIPSDSKYLVLINNTPPTITAATGVTRQQDAGVSNSTIATVNDDQDPKNTLTVTVNASTSATVNGVTVSNIAVDSSGNVTADIAAACGATAADFTLRVTDSEGLYDEDTLHVAVTPESTPPVINSVSASPNVLKPANHKLRLVTVSVSASDNCDPHPVSKIISVTNNEGDNDPRDMQITGKLTVKLEAEIDSNRKSRIYTIVVQCKDASGNASTATMTVRVKR